MRFRISVVIAALAAIIAASAFALGKKTDFVEVRAGSYNIRMSGMDNSSPDNNWSVRKDRLWTSIEKCGFDVFGLQEVSSEAQIDLTERFSEIYGLYFFSPYSEDGKGDKAQGIMYRKDVFDLADVHNFWIGPDPYVMSRSDVGAKGNYCRGGCCGILTHKASGIRFFFMNTHGSLNEDAKIRYAGVFEQVEKRYNPDGLPSIFVGDFNVKPDHQMYDIIAGYWNDSFSDASVKEGTADTFNAWIHPEGDRRIDFIFYRSGAEPLVYCCDNTLYDGQYPSDHFPLYTDFRIR